MTDRTLAFIGGGNMARSLIGGLRDQYPGESIRVADPVAEIRTALEKDFGVYTTDDNREVVDGAECIVLAVKPQLAQDALAPLAGTLSNGNPLLVSIAAGIRIASISQWLNGYENIVRVMPNTPALVQRGASGLFAGQNVSEQDRQTAFEIISAVGTGAWVDSEEMIDVVTALSGSGPAYFFYLLEIMADKATTLGLDADTARSLALQTALGAAELAQQSPLTFDVLRRNVTSPGGTTEAAINSMESNGARNVIGDGIQAAAERSDQLARQLGD